MRAVFQDGRLLLEAYRLRGAAQPFPNHFHDYYVIGCLLAGERRLCCGQTQAVVRSGQLLLFGPGDSHGCTQCGAKDMDYIAFNLEPHALPAARGQTSAPRFAQNIAADAALCRRLYAVHQMFFQSACPSEAAQQALRRLLCALLAAYGEKTAAPAGGADAVHAKTVAQVCAYLRRHYAGRITLEQLCACGHVSRSTLLRAFLLHTGVTPYRYLQAVRVGKARALLERGMPPADAALQTGFADQSHLSHALRQFTGLTPAVYKTSRKEV